MNGEDTDAHKLQYFPRTLLGKNASWFIHYETTNRIVTWGEVQCAFISKFSDVHNKKQAIVTLREVKRWKHETMEYYYNKVFKLCVVISQ